ncbi:hypothetical protein [Thiothrix sp. UBA2016]|nr:hypothetical protein [Thiothrix sp. UBA2016]
MSSGILQMACLVGSVKERDEYPSSLRQLAALRQNSGLRDIHPAP